jgi:hypothetical protein
MKERPKSGCMGICNSQNLHKTYEIVHFIIQYLYLTKEKQDKINLWKAKDLANNSKPRFIPLLSLTLSSTQ